METAFHTTELRSKETGQWLHQDQVRAVQKFEQFTTIDWMDDELEEHRQRLLKKRNVVTLKDALVQSTRTWLVLTAMGIMIGVIAALLNIITGWLAWLRLGHCLLNFYLSRGFCCWNQDTDQCLAWKPWLRFSLFRYVAYVMWLALFLWIAANLVKRYAPAAAGSGISEIKCIVSGFVMKGFLGWWTLAIKSLGLPLAIASGLSLGKEGPSVHYAVAVGNSVAKLFHSYRQSASKAREFLTATSAAGVAVAFGSPMGGVLFAMEEIAGVFQLLTLWKSYICALIAVATLAALNPFRTGQLVLFEVTYDTTWHYFELPLYALLGVFGGVYGIIVLRLNKRVAGFRKKYLANYAVREVVVLAVLTASISYFNQFLRLDMTEVMQELFSECLTTESELCDPKLDKLRLFLSLIFATVMRMALTIVTYGCKVPAGIFVPSMAAGATFGRAVGIVVDKLYQNYPDSLIFATCPAEGKCIIPGTYAFIGAGAALSGITHLTVTVAIIMFELTGAVRYIIPTMIAVAVTKIINDRWGQGGIADQMIVFNGLPYIDPKEEFVFNATVGAAMSTATVVFTCEDEYSMAEVRQILSATPYRGYPVVQSETNPQIVGYVSRSDLEHVLRDSSSQQECNFRASPLPHEDSLNLVGLINTSPLVVSIDTTLEYLLDIFVRLGPRHVLVEKDGVLVGNITRKDILRYEYTSHELHSPHVDDGLDARVWAIFQSFGQKLREKANQMGLERLAAFI